MFACDPKQTFLFPTPFVIFSNTFTCKSLGASAIAKGLGIEARSSLIAATAREKFLSSMALPLIPFIVRAILPRT